MTYKRYICSGRANSEHERAMSADTVPIYRYFADRFDEIRN
jgi:hypothetical protein